MMRETMKVEALTKEHALSLVAADLTAVGLGSATLISAQDRGPNMAGMHVWVVTYDDGLVTVTGVEPFGPMDSVIVLQGERYGQPIRFAVDHRLALVIEEALGYGDFPVNVSIEEWQVIG
jgi:hypothetical protein